VNNPPVIFPGHGIEIAFTQEALIVGLHQLVDGARIPAVLRVKHADSPGILQSPVHRLYFLIPAYLFRHLGCGHRQREQNQQDHEQHAEQQKSLLVTAAGLAGNRLHWRSGRLCVLW
jgi:hypothetical protein